MPHFIADLLELCPVQVYYKGCVAVEIRDYRFNPLKKACRKTLIVLRPSLQLLISDLNGLLEAAAEEVGRPLTKKEQFELGIDDLVQRLK